MVQGVTNADNGGLATVKVPCKVTVVGNLVNTQILVCGERCVDVVVIVT